MSKSIHYPFHTHSSHDTQFRYLTYHRLAKSNPKELEKIFERGTMPQMTDLEGWEFRGWNVSFVTRLLGFQKFRKGFLPQDGRLHPKQRYGYNVLIRQNGIEKPHHALPNDLNPTKHGFYLVTEPDLFGTEGLHPHALLLDYGRGTGEDPFYHPARFLRDYLVQVDENNKDLFLGKAYIALAGMRIFSGFFVLERYNLIGL